MGHVIPGGGGVLRGWIRILTLLPLTFTLITQCYGETGEVQLVQVVFRHGDRNPLREDFPPNDPYKKESFWPEGYAQLTNVGKRQQYDLGRWLGSRYPDLLSPSYSPDEILVQSSAVDRALMSAEANLAGLYSGRRQLPPNPSDPTWNEIEKDSSSTWMDSIVPIHSIPKDFDKTLQMSAPCPRLARLNSDLLSGPEMASIYTQNQELFEYLHYHSGKRMKSLLDIRSLYDVLEIEARNNYSLPCWTKGVFPGGHFHNLTSLSFRLYTWTQAMARLKAGPLLTELLHNVQKKVGGTEKRKMFIYSGHDSTTMSLLNALQVWNGLPPPYASAVIVELKKIGGSFFLEMYYKNDTTTQNPFLLTFPGCNFSCPLEKIVALAWRENIVHQDWEKECHDLTFGIGSVVKGVANCIWLFAFILIVFTARLG